MKTLRIFSLILIMSLLAAWSPAPAPLSALVKPTLSFPASGAYILATDVNDFKWKAATTGDFPAGYRLQISTTSSFTNPATLVVDESDIPVSGSEMTYQVLENTFPTNVKLTWRVLPQLDGVDGPASSTRYVFIRPEKVTTPHAPLNGDVVSAVRPVLTWEAVNNVESYDVQISLNNTFTSIKSSGVSTGTSYTPAADLARDTVYFWRVRSRAVTSMTRLPDEWLHLPNMTFKTPVNPPTVPALVSPSSGSTTLTFTPEFVWKAATTTDPANLPLTYNIELATDSKFVNIWHSGNVADIRYTLPDPLETGTYYWRVRAVDAIGQQGNWSAVRVIKTQPALHVLVRDYLSKEPMIGAPITISGAGLPAGQPYLTDSEGYYKINVLPAGSRTISVSVPDYLKKTISTSVPAGVVKLVILEPVRIPMKVTLTWPSTVKLDLDLNLWIPVAYDGGAPNYAGHVRNNLKGSTTKFPWAKLSGDDTTAPGLESITIQNRYPGTYAVAVFNKTYQNGNLSGSGAKVVLTRGTQTIGEWIVPASNPGYRWWFVFEMDEDGNPIGTINQMQVSPSVDYDPYPGDYAIPPMP